MTSPAPASHSLPELTPTPPGGGDGDQTVFDLASFSATGLRQTHDVPMTDLLTSTTLFLRITTEDANLNTAVSEISFEAGFPMYHIGDMTLGAVGSQPYTLTCTVLVVDQSGVPVVDIPVKGIWANDLPGASIGNDDFFPLVRTDGSGVATFELEYDPPSATTVTFSPVFVGTNAPGDPFTIGNGGDEPTFFYNQSVNEANYRSIALP